MAANKIDGQATDIAASSGLMLALRGTQGIQLIHGPPSNQPVDFFASLKMDSRFMVFSPQGSYLVYHTPTGVQLADLVNKETLDLGTGTVLVRDAAFSPQEGYLVLWDAPAKKEDNSCTVYDLKNRTVKAVYSQSETTWKVRWSHDEHLLFLMGKDQSYVFDHSNFSEPKISPKARIGELSISPASQPYHLIVFNPNKSTPGFVRLYRFPKMDDPADALAARSVVKEDQVIFKWNAQGTHVLFLASQDMDERSYYGSSQLFLMNTSSDSLIIGLDKEGPVHAWEWNPKGDTFCVVYGFMPGKTCIFSKKGDLVYTFDGQYRNGLQYNPFGNLMIHYGHGNIRGVFEIWDMAGMKKVCSQDSEYMTHIEWSPDGAIILLGTTSPRLKVGNKHALWHYTGKLLQEQPYTGELFQVCWRPAPPGTYKAPDPSKELGNNYVVNEPKKAAAYVPPSMRNRPSGPVGFSPAAQGASALYNDPSSVPRSTGTFGYAPVDEDAKSKAKKKKKPKSEAGKGEADGTAGQSGDSSSRPRTGSNADAYRPRTGSNADQAYRPRTGSNTNQVYRPRTGSNANQSYRPRTGSNQAQGNTPRSTSMRTVGQNGQNGQSISPASTPSSQSSKSADKLQKKPKPVERPHSPEPISEDENQQMVSTGDPEKDKKILKLNKKIQEINALRKEQAGGRVLEKNQLEKISRLDSINKDLEKLQLSAILKKK